RLSRYCSAHSGRGCLYVSLSAGNATLACGYEGSAFQAAVMNNLTFSPNGLNFHNRKQAKRGMR
ncbi:MAG: hypothetical protein LBG92_09200, partial [Prevotellaceae bacterium]|nr:hypothetical protein [Prevotellaceae bacterium]